MSALSHYGKSFVRGLINTFPNIGLDVTKFKQTTRKFLPVCETHFIKRFFPS